MDVKVGDLLCDFRGRLTENGIDEARHEAALLICARTGYTLAQIYSHPEWPIDKDQVTQLAADLKRRLAHEPIAYILGTTEFYGLTFAVGPGVLIPRADTERLVEVALDLVEQGFPSSPDSKTLKLLDTCAGTGCVGISIAYRLRLRQRRFDLTLVEKDPTASGFTRENMRFHGLETEARVEQADLWPSSDQAGSFDLITANPPYIARSLINRLMPDVAQFEPHMALDGGDEGLDLYRRIAGEAPDYLKRPGLLVLEHGYDQAMAVDDLLSRAGFVERIQVYDYGGQPRVTGGWLR